MSHNKNRILFVMHMPPPIHGASLIGHYIRRSDIVKEQFDCRYVDMTTAKSLEDIGKGGFRKYKRFFGMLIKAAKNIVTFRPDVIYITPNSAGGPFYKDFLVMMWIKLWSLNRIKIVAHFHNKGVKTKQDFRFDNLLYRLFFSKLRLILLAESLYDDVAKYVDKKRVFFCPNGIPAQLKDEDIPSERNNKVPVLLWVTNIMITKGIYEYIAALEILHNKGLRFHAIFVGDSTMEMDSEQLEYELTTSGLEDCSSYVGKKYGIEKAEYFKKADIFVLPSYTEAFPLSTLEAMAYKIPVVATNVGGVSEEIIDGKTGFLIGGETPIMRNDFRPNAQELADKLEILIRDKELRAKMGEAAFERFNEKFTVEAFEKNFAQTLQQIAEQ